jgi:hypothetical protein
MFGCLIGWPRRARVAPCAADWWPIGQGVGYRADGEHTHFATISLWDSETDIEAFSGHGDRTAGIEPRDAEFLVDSIPEAEHHVIAIESLG